MVGNSGCAYGKINREMIKNIDKSLEEFKREIKEDLTTLKNQNNELFNHMSNRLPPWATAIGAIGMAMIGTLIGKLI